MLKPLLKRLGNQQMKRISKSSQGAVVTVQIPLFLTLEFGTFKWPGDRFITYGKGQVPLPFEFRHEGPEFCA
jgi:hypothetical protein